jgi:Ca2+-transporting ATPase
MLSDFEIKNLKGLTSRQVTEKLINDGYNELPADKKKNFWHICYEVISEPMFILLIACSFIYFLLGDIHEAIMLFSVIFVIVGIAIFQENKTEKALDALRNLSSPRALVIRDGEQKRIAGRDVVPGDIIILNEGDRVPADGILLWSLNLNIDESILTGESMPVKKIPAGNESLAMLPPQGDNTPFIFSGSLVSSGQGVGLVKYTGDKTEMGKIGKMLEKIKDEKTPLQADTDKIVKIISLIGFILCILVVILYALTRGDIIKGFLAGLTLGMAIIPEEFPVVLTIFLSLGAWRISKKNVLARKMSAVETLGSATVLCVDKTGTLTTNKMALKQIYAGNKFYDFSQTLEAFAKDLLKISALACKQELFDPMEKAINELNIKLKIDISSEIANESLELVKEYPLSDKIFSMINVWRGQRDKNNFLISAKGAPEAIFDLCHLSESEIIKYKNAINQMAESGLRILGVAKSEYTGDVIPSDRHDYNFEFMGLLGFADPVRAGVPDAIKLCYRAGIKVIMITGDYQITASNIGRQIGLKNYRDLITGPELEKLNDQELMAKIKDVCIFCRVYPEQKLRIVSALKANSEIVAMTGDGVNDAPALKAAHIGIAMGERGTDVAREASAIVLLDDDFSSLVNGISVGRRIFDNMMKAMSFVISVHIPIAGLSLIPLIFKWPIIFFPVHIVFLELVVDPVCSVLFEAEPAEKNIMERPPRNPKRSIFNKEMLGKSIMQGVIMLIIFLTVFRLAIILNKTTEEARAITFSALIFSNLALILSSRSNVMGIVGTLKKKNNVLWIIFLSTLLLLAISIYLPILRGIFGFDILSFYDLLFAFIASLASIAWFEYSKRVKL